MLMYNETLKNVIEKMGTSKASKIAQRVVAGAGVVGATDFIASPDQRRIPTLFVQPEDTSKLSGRKKAAAMFRNKVKYGAEGALVGGLFPIVGKTVQQAYKWGARPVGEPFVRMGFNVAGAGFKGTASLLSTLDKPLHSQIVKSLSKSVGNTVKKIVSPMTQKLGLKGLPPFEEWRLFQTISPSKSERKLKRIDKKTKCSSKSSKPPPDLILFLEHISPLQKIAPSIQIVWRKFWREKVSE